VGVGAGDVEAEGACGAADAPKVILEDACGGKMTGFEFGGQHLRDA
jgi:hypothetical protein